MRICLVLFEEESLEKRRVDEGQRNYHREEGVICEFSSHEIVVIHAVDESVLPIVDIAGTTPVIYSVIYQVFIRIPDNRGFLWWKLTVNEFNFRLFENLVDLIDRSKSYVNFSENCVDKSLLTLDG